MLDLGLIVSVLLVLLVLFVAAGVTVAVVVTRRVVRAGRRKVRAVQTTARAVLPSATQPVHAVRAQVSRDLSSACSAIDAARAAGRPVQPFAASRRRLEYAAQHLDLDLTIIASEPDPHARAALLAGQSDRLGVFSHACAQLRAGALLAGVHHGADVALAQVARELDDEIDRLTLEAGAYEELTRGPRRF